MRIVTNSGWGCPISQEACDRYNELCREQDVDGEQLEDRDDARANEKKFRVDQRFVRVVEELLCRGQDSD